MEPIKERMYQIMKSEIIEDKGDSLMSIRFLHCIDKDTLMEQVKCIFAEAGKLKEYDHSLKVADNIEKLSAIYGLDKTQAYTAAMLHDTGKIIKAKNRVDFCNKNNIEILDVEKNHPELLHQKISAKIAELIFSIDDKEILNALSVHTTLRSEPGMLDKMLFIADKLSFEEDEYKEIVKKMKTEVFEDSSAENAISIYLKHVFSTVDDKKLHPWMKQAYEKFNRDTI